MRGKPRKVSNYDPEVNTSPEPLSSRQICGPIRLYLSSYIWPVRPQTLSDKILRNVPAKFMSQRILILGGGFGGLFTALRLGGKQEATLVSHENRRRRIKRRIPHPALEIFYSLILQ